MFYNYTIFRLMRCLHVNRNLMTLYCLTFFKTMSKLFTGLHESKLFFNLCLFKVFL